MNIQSCHNTKVAVIGAGNVGATCAFSLMTLTDIPEIVLVDVNHAKAEGEALDLKHGLSFIENKNVYAGSYEDVKGADFIVITAGAKQKPGESRTDLVARNYEVLKAILEASMKQNSDAIYVLVSNPVDVLTYAAKQITGLPRSQVFGTGTNLDSSRFKYLIAKELGVSPNEVNAYILGEHGDSEFPLKSQISVSGLHIGSIKELPKIDVDKLYQQTKNAAYEVIERKGATYYAISLSVVDIIKEILHDQGAINPLSVCLEGEYGISDIAISVPVILGRTGIKDILEIDMTVQEEIMLRDSANTLKKVYASVA